MPINLTTATVYDWRMVFAGGQVVAIVVTYQMAPAGPDPVTATHAFTLTPAQQAGAASFVAAVVAQLAAITGLNVVLNPD